PLFFNCQVLPSSIDLKTPLEYTLAYNVRFPGGDAGSRIMLVAGESIPIPSTLGSQVLPPSVETQTPPFAYFFQPGLLAILPRGSSCIPHQTDHALPFIFGSNSTQ